MSGPAALRKQPAPKTLRRTSPFRRLILRLTALFQGSKTQHIARSTRSNPLSQFVRYITDSLVTPNIPCTCRGIWAMAYQRSVCFPFPCCSGSTVSRPLHDTRCSNDPVITTTSSTSHQWCDLEASVLFTLVLSTLKGVRRRSMNANACLLPPATTRPAHPSDLHHLDVSCKRRPRCDALTLLSHWFCETCWNTRHDDGGTLADVPLALW